MAENKDRVYVTVEGPFGELCSVPADKLGQFEENKRKIQNGERVMPQETEEKDIDEALAYLKKLAGRE